MAVDFSFKKEKRTAVKQMKYSECHEWHILQHKKDEPLLYYCGTCCFVYLHYTEVVAKIKMKNVQKKITEAHLNDHFDVQISLQVFIIKNSSNR